MGGLTALINIVIVPIFLSCAMGATTPSEFANDYDVEHAKINTADASPVDPGNLELKLGYSFARATRMWDSDGNLRDRGRAEEHASTATLEYGVIENLDVGLGLDYLWLRDDESMDSREDAFGDLRLGARYRFLNDEERRLEMALLAGVTIPTGSSPSSRRLGTSQEFWDWGSGFVVTKDWGRWTCSADIGYLLPVGEEREDFRGTLSANVAAGYQWREWIQPEVELNYAREFFSKAADSDELAVTAGLIMPVAGRLRIDLGVQQGIWGRNTDRATTFTIALKIAL